MSARSNRAGLFITALLTSGAWNMPLMAQTAAESSAANETASAPGAVVENVEDIVVTARKRAERVIDVPTSITALSSAELSRYASSNFESIGSLVPQVTITQNPTGTGAIVTIRGIGTNNTGDDGVEQAVSFNVDGVPTSRGRILQQAMFDLSDVQVLKGPQALYFGKNSPGGVLIANSRGPTETLSGYISSGYEFRAKEFFGEAALGGPLTDSLGFRVALRGSDMRGGYVRNVSAPIAAVNSPIASDRINSINLPGATYKWGPGTKQYAGRLTLAYNSGGPFKATFKLFGSYYHTNGETSQVLMLSCPAGFPNGALTDLGALAFGLPVGVAQDPSGECNPKKRVNSIGSLPASLAKFPGMNGGNPYSTTKNYLSSLNLEYKPDNITVTSITGYYEYSNRYFANFDWSTFNLVQGVVLSTNKSWTQEVRAVSSFDGPLNFSIGAFYENDRRRYPNSNTVIRSVLPGSDNSIVDSVDSDFSGSAYSAVAELTWKPVHDVEIAGGVRYTKEKKKSFIITNFRAPGLASALGIYGDPGVSVSPRFTASNVSPQVTVSWKPTPNANIFFGYRTGFKSGGISSPAILAPSSTAANVVFANEKVHGVEGGVKFQSEDRKLHGDITLYQYVYKGLQVSSYDAAINLLRIQNAGGANVNGVEGSLDYAATRELSLHGSVGYNRARYSTFDNAACYAGQNVSTGCNNSQQNLTGRPLPRAPDWQGDIGLLWDKEITNGYRLGASVDARYSSGYFVDTPLSPFGRQKGYPLLDASIRLHDAADRWEVALIGRNLTDKYYATFGTDRPLGVAPGSLIGVAGLPRTVELQIKYNF